MALCNDFNSCKLTVSEYLAERQVSHDSYVAVLAMKRAEHFDSDSDHCEAHAGSEPVR